MALVIQGDGEGGADGDFFKSVVPIVANIKTTQTGRLVLRLIDAAPYDVVIQPNTDPNGAGNAFATPASVVHAGNAKLDKAARGTRSFIEFSPGRLSGKGVQFAHHEVLLHELCHGLRQATGRERLRNGNPLKMASFDNVEEFFAAMVTSVHSSELGRPALGNHGSWALPSVDRLRQAPFNTRLRQFRVSMPVLCKELANIPPNVAAFNPFRDIQ